MFKRHSVDQLKALDYIDTRNSLNCKKNLLKEETPLSSISLLQMELPESTFGWPLLRKSAPVSQEALRKFEARTMSVAQWVVALPSQSRPLILQNRIDNSVIDLDSNKTAMSFYRDVDNSTIKEWDNEEGTLPQVIQAPEDAPVGGCKNLKIENIGLVREYKVEVCSSPISFLTKESPKSRPGWPLLRVATSASLDCSKDSEARNMSVVQWVMNLPNRSISVAPQIQIGLVSNKIENNVERERYCSGNEKNRYCSTVSRKLHKLLELLIRTNSFDCRWFSYKELQSATSHFSSENLIGEGGSSTVYRGSLPCGRLVAVKKLKPYKEAWNDFYLEIDIISTLKHNHITSLIGICVEDDYLISVYDFFPMGSLEENLHGHSNRSVLPWKVRFEVAVAVAEALNYLHNESSRPVIHRDIKSSNILLSDEFQPQLSDFGLAIWGPTDSTYMIHSDVVGSFGYIAPEYFMYGRVNDKIDVYSLGVVLLELLSGRRPIGPENLKGQRSLVKWAKPLLQSGDVEPLLDPKLDGNFDVDQMHRMVLAATLCISQSPQLRPKVRQILKLLTGEKDINEDSENEEDEDLFPEFGCKPHTSFALLEETDDDTRSLSSADTTLSSAEKTQHFMLKDYLKERQH